MGPRWIALSEAALLAGMNRERLLRLVQAGVVLGRRNLTGRWEVDRAALKRHLAGSEGRTAVHTRQDS
jgi:hypothetical protein